MNLQRQIIKFSFILSDEQQGGWQWAPTKSIPTKSFSRHQKSWIVFCFHHLVKTNSSDINMMCRRFEAQLLCLSITSEKTEHCGQRTEYTVGIQVSSHKLKYFFELVGGVALRATFQYNEWADICFTTNTSGSNYCTPKDGWHHEEFCFLLSPKCLSRGSMLGPRERPTW